MSFPDNLRGIPRKGKTLAFLRGFAIAFFQIKQGLENAGSFFFFTGRFAKIQGDKTWGLLWLTRRNERSRRMEIKRSGYDPVFQMELYYPTAFLVTPLRFLKSGTDPISSFSPSAM